MMKVNFEKIKFIANKVIKLGIVMFFVFVIIDGSSRTMETKVINGNLNRTLNLTSMGERVWEDIQSNYFAALDVLSGDLTGYAAHCPLCNGTLACAPRFEVYRNGVTTFMDESYGEVRIVAASSRNLPCGSIVRFETNRVSSGPTIAIVLDRGVPGTDLDILMATEEEARLEIGRSRITYDVLRFGWER